MQASHTASRCMQKIHQLQVVCREEHVGGAHPKKIKNPEPMNSARECLDYFTAFSFWFSR